MEHVPMFQDLLQNEYLAGSSSIGKETGLILTYLVVDNRGI